MGKKKVVQRTSADYIFWGQRLLIALAAVFAFLPAINPIRINDKIDANIALFTSLSYNSLISKAGLLLRRGTVTNSSFVMAWVASIVMLIGIVILVIAVCLSLGNIIMKRLSAAVTLIGAGIGIVGCMLAFIGNHIVKMQKYNAPTVDFNATLSIGLILITVVFVLLLIIGSVLRFSLPSGDEEEELYMDPKFKLFLMFLPFGILAFLFCYLPLWGWRYAFFDYQAGGTLSMDNWVGFKWFGYLFKNAATRVQVVRVMRNTLIMSFLGICTSWLPMVFAIFLTEAKSEGFRRFVQIFTTIPNFISWVLVYSLAISIFDTTGFINQMRVLTGSLASIDDGKNYLMSNSFIWVKMWAWGTWKGIGWSAIIYIAGISGIAQELYEAATVDGAGRFQKMWHITVPGLLPTFFVLLLMSVAAILSNGLDQYLVFQNALNEKQIKVLDLYVYELGLGGGGSIPLSTVVGMFKSIISVILLFAANAASKALRGESII
ncbi:MAG: ABC transporter permease subunit [Lachnospiraceae bacterium]|nr:ABC transporter permease subunit [Lachnospiraceae bacterium]